MILAATCLAASGLLAGLALKETRAAKAARAHMLDGCRGAFDVATPSVAPDGFSRLSGTLDGMPAKLALVPDTFAPKRLPQLWMVLSLRPRTVLPDLAVTARPRSEDVVTRAGVMRHFLTVPEWLPQDCTVRANDTAALTALAALRSILEPAFRDPRFKEISLGMHGVRVVYQADEGQRGAHLLLRQSRFTRSVEPEHVRQLGCMATEILAALITPECRSAA